MKLHWILFGLLLTMCIVVGIFFILDEVPLGRTAGYAHAQFPGIDQGGPGLIRHASIIWLAWVFAVLQTVFLIVCLAFGVPHGERRQRLKVPLVIAGVLLICIVTMMFVSYQQFMMEDTHPLFFSFPVTTAWYLYGFWPFQFFFVLLYVVVFRRTIVTDDDLAKFQKLLATKRRERGNII
jgi:hypothetical protein